MSARLLVLASLAAGALPGCMGPLRHDAAKAEAQQRWNRVRADVKARLASEQLASGQLEKAGAAIGEARQLDPHNEALQLMQARALIGRGESAQAGQLLDAFAPGGPHAAEVAYLRGVIAEQRLDWPAALDHFLSAIDHDPDDVANLTAAVQVLLQLGEARPALALLQMHEPQHGWRPAFQAAAAECHEQLGDWARAAAAWRQVVGDEADPAVRERLALALWRSGQWAQASELLRELIDDPEREQPAALRVALAECYTRQNRPDEARDELNAVLRESPRNVPALVALARLLAQQGAFEQALHTAAACLALEPEHAGMLELAATLAHRLGWTDQAQVFARRVQALAPDSPVPPLILGRSE